MSNKVIPFTDYKTIAPADMDSFDSDTMKKSDSIYHSNHSGGGSGMDKFASGDLSKIGGIMPSFADTMLQSIGILNNGDKLIKPIAAYL